MTFPQGYPHYPQKHSTELVHFSTYFRFAENVLYSISRQGVDALCV